MEKSQKNPMQLSSFDAAHELRTPLAAIKTQSQVTLMSSTVREYKVGLKKIIKQVDRATHVVEQLLTLSRLGERKSLADSECMNLTSVAAETLAQLAPLAIDKKIDIELDAPKAVKIEGSEILICVLIRNLVANAIQYTPESGRIVVVLAENDGEVVLSVRDTGPGVSEELRGKVFERFYRVSGNKTTGSGLGLTIVKRIADLHSAKIELAAPDNGVGLLVTVIFRK